MSEKILKALMQLFAIIAKVEAAANSGRAVVESFLKQQVNNELVEEYLVLYDEFVKSHHNNENDKIKKRTSVNSVKVLLICTQINTELTQRQKIVVLIRLIDFINSNSDRSDQDLEFVHTVSSTFNIEEEEFIRCLNFMNSKASEHPDSPSILIINNKQEKEETEQRARHLFVEALTGHLRVLQIQSVNMYALRYFGKSELYLNGQPLYNEKTYILTQGSSIRSSKVNPIYYSDIISTFLDHEQKAKIVFTADAIEYRFKNGKIGMHRMSLCEESGTLVGIMGGSGAGKSTLLNILNGNEKPSSGAVTINGVDVHTEKEKIEGVVGFISQDDLLIEQLTVFQNLFYNAKLCFDGFDDDYISKLVLDLLLSLGLYETKDLKVGTPLDKTISGGQRKRLNIALELIREPSVLFVDEPTSGLSSRDSENIMDLLKELALKGKLIFVVIHQPSSDIFKMFDKLIILDVGGFNIYNGNPVEAVIYFKTIVNHVNAQESECPTCGNVNPEQIFNIIESKVLDEYGNLTQNRKVAPKEWNDFYNEKLAQSVHILPDENIEVPSSTFKVPGKLKQFSVFITRDILSKLTDKQYLLISLLEAPILAFVLAFLVKFYFLDAGHKAEYVFNENENLPAYIFISVVVSLFVGLTASAEEIIKDRKILKRESFLNLSRGSYLFSKISIMFLLSAIQTLTFVLAGNTVLEIQGMNMDYWMVLFTSSCFANMLGLNISASFNNAVTIYILIPFLIIPQLILSGVIVKFDKLNPTISSQENVPIVGEIMTSRWAFEALAVNQFKNNKFEKNLYFYDKIISIADFKKTFLIDELIGKVDKCENTLNESGDSKGIADDLKILKLEIDKEAILTKRHIPEIDMLTVESFDSSVAAAIRKYLAETKKMYMRKSNEATAHRDALISKMSDTPEKHNRFVELQNDYENESLSDLVKNKNDAGKIAELNGHFVQHVDPIFLDPSRNSFINAHFFAPRKSIFGRYFDTYWVNILVIWCMSLGLIFTLYFDLLKKFISKTGDLFGRFRPNASKNNSAKE